MKKVSKILSLLVVFGILLAACAPGIDILRTGTPGIPVGSNSPLTPGIPVTGNGTTTPTGEMLTTQPTVATTSTTNANPTVAASPTLKATESVSSTSMPSTSTNTSLLSNQMHFKVVDEQNQTIGQVKDLVLDFTAGKVAYVVVTTTGGTAYVPGDIVIPWNLLRAEDSMASDSSNSTSSNSSMSATSTPTNLTPVATLKSNDSNADNTNGVFVFTGDTKMLSNTPAFKESDLPDLGKISSDWDSILSNFWKGSAANSTPTTATATPSMTLTPAATSTTAAGQSMTAVPVQGVILASKLIGFNVMDNNNTEIAKVSDAVVDVSTGMINYVLVTFNGKLIPVPLPSLGLDSKNQVVVGVGGMTVLQGAPSFDLNSIPAMSISDWDAQLKTFWQNQTLIPVKP